jgi:hypothetical protein
VAAGRPLWRARAAAGKGGGGLPRACARLQGLRWSTAGATGAHRGWGHSPGLTAVGTEGTGPGLAAELARRQWSAELRRGRTGGVRPCPSGWRISPAASRSGIHQEEMEWNPALPRSSPGPSAAGFAREGTGIDGRLPSETRPPPSMGTWGRRQPWLPRRWSAGPRFVRERKGGEKNEAFFSVTSGSAGNSSSPKPLKAGCGRLLQMHYGKATLECCFSHSRGPLFGLLAFGESHSRRKLNQRHPKYRARSLQKSRGARPVQSPVPQSLVPPYERIGSMIS